MSKVEEFRTDRPAKFPIALITLSLIGGFVTLGCRMCASPYDYCGPVGTCRGKVCDPYERTGSVLSGSNRELLQAFTPADAPQETTHAPDQAFKDLVAGEQVHSIRILSITDHKLEPGLTALSAGSGDKAQQLPGAQLPQLSDRSAAEDTGGWTAIR